MRICAEIFLKLWFFYVVSSKFLINLPKITTSNIFLDHKKGYNPPLPPMRICEEKCCVFSYRRLLRTWTFMLEVVREKRQFKVMHTIEQKSDEDCMCPHLYNVARRCYREMMSQHQASVPLSILLTGRSGSGKTRRLKSLLHFYCTTVCSRKRFLNCE